MATATAGNKKRNAGRRSQRHDTGYKDILSDCAIFLHFLKKYFCKPWTANISVADVERVNKSFVTSEFKHLDSDLIYKLKINGSDVYFYVLIELQSKIDFTMPFRLLRYMVELLNVIFRNTSKKVRERKDFRLPAIVPIVLYNGKANWTPPMTYGEYTKDYGIFGDNIINFRYLLFDLNRMDEEAIEPVEDPLDAVFVVEKLRLRQELTPDKLSDWWDEKTSNLSDGHKDTLLNWVDHVHFSGQMPPEIKDTLKNNPKGGSTVKSFVDDLVEKGERRGMREGMRNGRKQEALQIARNLKAKGISIDDIAEATGLTVDDVLKL